MQRSRYDLFREVAHEWEGEGRARDRRLLGAFLRLTCTAVQPAPRPRLCTSLGSPAQLPRVRHLAQLVADFCRRRYVFTRSFFCWCCHFAVLVFSGASLWGTLLRVMRRRCKYLLLLFHTLLFFHLAFFLFFLFFSFLTFSQPTCSHPGPTSSLDSAPVVTSSPVCRLGATLASS